MSGTGSGAAPTTGGAPDPAELVSAALDGELGPDEREALDGALAGPGSEVLRREQEQTARVRELVRSLPAVDPPVGALERIARELRRPVRSIRHHLAAWVLVLATVVLVLVVAPGPTGGTVGAAPADLVAHHDAVVAAGLDPATRAGAGAGGAADGYRPVDATSVGDAYVAPVGLGSGQDPAGGWTLVGASRRGAVLRLAYEGPGGSLSLFEVPGDDADLGTGDWEPGPAGDGSRSLVGERRSLVIVLVADEGADLAAAWAAVGDPDLAPLSELRLRCAGVVESLGFEV